MSRSERRRLTGGSMFGKIAQIVRDRIERGVYAPGEYLPSESAMCREFLIARNSLRRGLALLEEEGLIRTIPAKGRIVQDQGGTQAGLYLYQRIAADLRTEIAHGALTKIPSELALKRHYGASRNSVRQALALLEQEGLVRTEQGRGRFVRRK